ncbi:MAG TPA: hypothetical protein VGB90_09760 [Alphaproteobacteria bacterium]|jgi:hypothetical protein
MALVRHEIARERGAAGTVAMTVVYDDVTLDIVAIETTNTVAGSRLGAGVKDAGEARLAIDAGEGAKALDVSGRAMKMVRLRLPEGESIGVPFGHGWGRVK